MHCCRHTFATLALEAGRNIKWVAEVLGNSDPSITPRTYAHAIPRDADGMGFLSAPVEKESRDRPRKKTRKLAAV
jgi:hypothetical protein